MAWIVILYICMSLELNKGFKYIVVRNLAKKKI